MKNSKTLSTIIGFLILFFAQLTFSAPLSNGVPTEDGGNKRFWVTAELGSVWQSRNDVQIPADTGTRFSLSDLDGGGEFTGRLYLGYKIKPKHEVRGLYAPLTLNLDGTYASPINFEGGTFVANTPIEAKYKFNSYRLTYRYSFLISEKWHLKWGVTGKVRHAEIQLTQGATQTTRKDTGFVPLLHFQGQYVFSPEWYFQVDLDALISSQGRAEDLALLLGYNANPEISLYGGYRTVEGGTDGSGGAYNFSWLHYAVGGLEWRF